MGYKPAVNTAKKFTYDDFPGLEIYADMPSMGDLMDVADLRVNMNDADDKRMRAFDMFASYIKTWNIEHPTPRKFKVIKISDTEQQVTDQCARCGLAEDEPMPTTGDAMLCLPMPFIMPVFFGWLSSVSRVDPTKYMNFGNGESNIQEELMKRLAILQSPMPSSEQNMS